MHCIIVTKTISHIVLTDTNTWQIVLMPCSDMIPGAQSGRRLHVVLRLCVQILSRLSNGMRQIRDWTTCCAKDSVETSIIIARELARLCDLGKPDAR